MDATQPMTEIPRPPGRLRQAVAVGERRPGRHRNHFEGLLEIRLAAPVGRWVRPISRRGVPVTKPEFPCAVPQAAHKIPTRERVLRTNRTSRAGDGLRGPPELALRGCQAAG